MQQSHGFTVGETVGHNRRMSDLETRLVAAATDPTRAPDFITALLDAQVVVAGEIHSEAVDGEVGVISATLPPLVRPDGTSVQPFFTSFARLQETLQAVPGYETRYITMRCRDMWEMTRGSTLVLNPHSAYGKEFRPGEIAQLLAGAAAMTTRIVTEPTRVLVGRPAQTPNGMEQALRDLFSRHAGVESAHLGWKVAPDSGDQSYLLIIVGLPTIRTEMGDELGRALLSFSQAHPIDVMFTDPGADHLLSAVEAFYVRR
jgi:hypothetical protein